MQNHFIPAPLPIDPAEEIKILVLEAEPYSDNRRVKVNFMLSSFIQGPSAQVRMTADGRELSSISIVNIFTTENEITLHIPGDGIKPGKYQLDFDLFFIIEEEYKAEEEVKIRLKQNFLDHASVAFTIQ